MIKMCGGDIMFCDSKKRKRVTFANPKKAMKKLQKGR